MDKIILDFYRESIITILSKLKQKTDEYPDSEWIKEIYIFLDEWNNNEILKVKTSGSTGKQKFITLTKEKMMNSAKLTIEHFGFQPNDQALLCIPAKYIAGKMMIVRSLEARLKLVCIEPGLFPVNKLDEDIDFAAMIPLQVKNSMTNKYSFNKIKKVLIGGGSVSSDLKDKLQHIKTEAWASYGMTETITHIALSKLNGDDAQDNFHPLPGITVSKNENNCLKIDAPSLNDETLQTNDIVELSSDQSFKWVGRFDNIINSGGIKLSPETIERKLDKLIFRKYFISSLKHEEFGEIVALFIEGRPLDNECHERFVNRIKKALEKYEVPKKIIHIKNFILTETGKIQRDLTKAEYLNKGL
jgi:O-succinylbenzoic acid--CoA ligase